MRSTAFSTSISADTAALGALALDDTNLAIPDFNDAEELFLDLDENSDEDVRTETQNGEGGNGAGACGRLKCNDNSFAMTME